MCPDRQIISLYFDSELPSPWKEKLETHLKSCTECRKTLAGYGKLEECLHDAPGTAIEAAQERVWEKLGAWNFPAAKPTRESWGQKSAGAVKRAWNQRVTLPLPAAAAAAVLVFVAFFALIGIRGLGKPASANLMSAAASPEMIPPAEFMAAAPEYLQLVGDDQGIIPMQDMAGVLQYLSSQDYGDFMVIRLPESRKFSRIGEHIGEPALINATDYSRRNVPR